MNHKNQLALDYERYQAQSEDIDTYSTAEIEEFISWMNEIEDEMRSMVEGHLLKYMNWECSHEGRITTVTVYDLDGDGEWDGFTETKLDILDFVRLEDLHLNIENCFNL